MAEGSAGVGQALAGGSQAARSLGHSNRSLGHKGGMSEEEEDGRV